MSRSTKYYRSKSSPVQSLLEYLTGAFRYHSSEEWNDAIVEGRVSVNGQPAIGPDSVLQQGDTIEYRPVQSAEPPVDTENIDFLSDGPEMIVVVKNGNIPVAPGGRYTSNTLLSVLERTHGRSSDTKRARSDEASESKDHDQPGNGLFLVHRIDKETSGIVVIAKSSLCASRLTCQFAEHSGDGGKKAACKMYVAVVNGVMTPVGKTVCVRERIGFHKDRPGASQTQFPKLKMAVFPQDSVTGKESCSLVRCIATDPDKSISVVVVFPQTGRTHQIRLHCAHLGHPVLGDKLYSTTSLGAVGGSFAFDDELFLAHARETRPIVHPGVGVVKRHLLHAATLSIFAADEDEMPKTYASSPLKWFLSDCAGLAGATCICEALDSVLEQANSSLTLHSEQTLS